MPSEQTRRTVGKFDWRTTIVAEYILMYVALSRAAFFMAVTSDGSNQEISDKLKSMLDGGGKWKDIVEAYKK